MIPWIALAARCAGYVSSVYPSARNLQRRARKDVRTDAGCHETRAAIRPARRAIDSRAHTPVEHLLSKCCSVKQRWMHVSAAQSLAVNTLPPWWVLAAHSSRSEDPTQNPIILLALVYDCTDPVAIRSSGSSQAVVDVESGFRVTPAPDEVSASAAVDAKVLDRSPVGKQIDGHRGVPRRLQLPQNSR